MGYYINLRQSNFKIKTGKEKEALEVLKILAKDDKCRCIVPDVGNFDNLHDALYACGWNIDTDVIEFYGEKYREDNKMFEALSPFVVAGSYIEMSGEQDDYWRWKFDGEKMKEIEGKIIFEDEV